VSVASRKEPCIKHAAVFGESVVAVDPEGMVIKYAGYCLGEKNSLQIFQSWLFPFSPIQNVFVGYTDADFAKH
jgi:hypothetical protein